MTTNTSTARQTIDDTMRRNVRIPSIQGALHRSVHCLCSVKMDCPGFTDDTDAEIWEWANSDDFNSAIDNLTQARDEIIRAIDSIHRKRAEFSTE